MSRNLICCLFIICLCAGISRGELVTYRLIDGAAGDQAGHTLSGTITLDPACAAMCTELPAWEYTVSGPIVNRSVSSEDVGPLFFNNFGLFVATEDALTVDFRERDDGAELLMDLAGLAFLVEVSPGLPASRAYWGYDFDSRTGTTGWNVTPEARIITIAEAVPEPGSQASFGGGLLCLLIGFRRFGRGSLRRSTSDH